MVLASVRLAEDVVVEGPPCHIKSVTQLMDTERIARSMIEFLKSGKLFLQGYIRQILGLANDLHMLTAIEDEYTQVTSFDEQADDYITKPFSMVLVGRRITALLRRTGKNVISDTMAFGDVVVDFSGYTAKDTGGKIDITPKEIDLLRLLVEHRGLVLTRSQILDDLWGIDSPIIDRTIDTYIKNLRKKLRLDCIVTVKGIGYKYEVVQ